MTDEELIEPGRECIRRMYRKVDADIDFDEDREKFKPENQGDKPIYQKYSLEKEVQDRIIEEVAEEYGVNASSLSVVVNLSMPSPKFKKSDVE